MTDIKLDRTLFRIVHIHGAVDISFVHDVDHDVERRIGVARYHPLMASFLDEIHALPIPGSVHSPIVDRYAEILKAAFGVGVKIMAGSCDARLVEQGWTSRFERKRDKW